MSETPSNRPARRLPRVARRAALTALAAAAAWLVLILYPQPLFAYSLRRGNLVLHARAPLPPQAAPMLDEVVRRLAASPLYDPGRTHDVFLCDTPALFTFFVLWDRRAGGVAHVHLTGNAFIRPASVARDRVIGFSGRETPGERTLTYFIAHESAHAMTAAHTGRVRYARLAAFQQEGYADYVAFDRRAHRVDLAAGRDALLHDAPEMDPKRSGLYRRHELLVAYLLQRRGMTARELLAQPLDRHLIEQQLLDEDLPGAAGGTP